MNKQFEDLQHENDNLRKEFALLVRDLTISEQKRIFDILNQIVDIEIKQEKFCNF